MSSIPHSFEHVSTLDHNEFSQELKKLAASGLSSEELSAIVREVMEDRSDARVASLLAQWGKDVAFDIMDWGMFWQYPGVEQALPYFDMLTPEQQKILVYRAVSEGYSEVVERSLPVLDVDDHWKIISETFELFPQIANAIFLACDAPVVIEKLRDNHQDHAAQWLDDMYRPVREKHMLETAISEPGKPSERRKI